MSRYEKSYRHINSQCEKKTVIFFFFFFALLEEKESERETETLLCDLRTIKNFYL